MDKNTINRQFDEIIWEMNENPSSASELFASFLISFISTGYNQKALARAIAKLELENHCKEGIENFAKLITDPPQFLDIRYSKVYSADDITEKDLEFIERGTPSGGYVLVGSDDHGKIEKHPEDCVVGVWGYGVMDFGNGEGHGISLLTRFKRNENDMPYGDVSFADSCFKYVRFVENPYGEKEFDKLPSDKD